MANKTLKNKKLLIVESPTKARTISEFLGNEYKVESSYGHIRDLPKSSIGVDIEHNFTPKYIIPTKSRKNVTNLKKLAEKLSDVIIATDEDREGEAIAWHIAQALNLEESQSPNSKTQTKSRAKSQTSKLCQRIVFHEITKDAIQKALENPRSIDMNLVDAQQARRVLDRLVGYKLSPFLWKKVASHLSAGRVQSVALRLIVDREDEIRSFKPEKYWTIDAIFVKDGIEFNAPVIKIDGENFPKPGIKEENQVDEIVKNLNQADFLVTNIDKRETKRSPLPPFTTSTLQQEASKRLYFSAKQTMMFAQRLYEKGLITYMRTDSVNLSEISLKMAKSWIGKKFGEKYTLDKPRFFKTKSRLAQEAHEAIRPVKLEPDTEKLEKQEVKLFELIRNRFLASQMPPAVFKGTKIDIEAKAESKKYLLRVNGSILKFDGYMKVWLQKYEEKKLPEFLEDEEIKPENIKPEEHETIPPPRYNEASIVKTLEENGIGRPSTYVPIISVLIQRNYTEKDSNRRFHPTEIGELVNKVLKEHFPNIVNVNFTAEMEKKLDEVAAGKEDWHKVIQEFYNPFNENLEKKYEQVSKESLIGKIQETDEKCEKCGRPMVIKQGRFGKFLACSGFPECKNTRSLESEDNTFGKCPKCGKGIIVKKRTRKGRYFFGCDRYPDCDFAKWNEKELKETQEED